MAHSIATVRALKSSLSATAGGKRPGTRIPKHDVLSQGEGVEDDDIFMLSRCVWLPRMPDFTQDPSTCYDRCALLISCPPHTWRFGLKSVFCAGLSSSAARGTAQGRGRVTSRPVSHFLRAKTDFACKTALALPRPTAARTAALTLQRHQC